MAVTTRWPGIGAAREALRSQLWPVPVLGVLLAIGLGIGLPLLDDRLVGYLPEAVTHYLFRGGPAAGRGVLAAVAGSLITVTSLTFSLTVVTLQLASSQHSPRVLRTFTQDRVVHLTLAVLLGTFTYALSVMRALRTDFDDTEPFVPQLSVTVAYLLSLASVITLVLFLAHLARKIRVESMLRDVHTETSSTLHRLTSGSAPTPPETDVEPGPHTIAVDAATSGFLTAVDEQALLRAATDDDAVIHVHREPGESVIAGTPVALVWPAGAEPLGDDARGRLQECVRRGVHVAFERTAEQDLAYGLRQIVDIALRALSPGVNDPTTAVHALSHAAALLCEAARHSVGPGMLLDDTGRVRVVLDRPDLGSLLDLAIAQPARYGAEEPEVVARLLALLREVAWSTKDSRHHEAIREHLQLLCDRLATQSLPPRDQVRLQRLASHVHEATHHRWPRS